MSLPTFQKALTHFVDPWRSLVQLFCEHLDDYPNAVVQGQYPADEQVTMNAWAIVGLAPQSLKLTHRFLEGHLTTGNVDDKPKWISQLLEATSSFSVPLQFAGLNPDLIGQILESKLGLNKLHVVGVISLHCTVRSNQDFVVLWMNRHLNRSTVEYVMKIVLNERLK